MKHSSAFFLTIFFVVSLLTAIAQPVSTALNNIGVIDMHKSGLSTDIILTSIATSTCKFNVTSVGLVALKKAGVDESVIKAMIEKQAPRAPSEIANINKNSTEKKNTSSIVKAEKSISLDLLNHVYHSSSPTAAQPLEKSVAGIRTKQTPFSSSVLWQVEGTKSTLRLSSEGIASFLINTGNESLPELVLYKLNVVKGKREVVTMKAGPTGLKTGEEVITLDISKQGNGIFKITPGKKLIPGEYFFTGKPAQGSSSSEAFAFGID